MIPHLDSLTPRLSRCGAGGRRPGDAAGKAPAGPARSAEFHWVPWAQPATPSFLATLGMGSQKAPSEEPCKGERTGWAWDHSLWVWKRKPLGV